jgi:hypothetical protein
VEMDNINRHLYKILIEYSVIVKRKDVVDHAFQFIVMFPAGEWYVRFFVALICSNVTEKILMGRYLACDMKNSLGSPSFGMVAYMEYFHQLFQVYFYNDMDITMNDPFSSGRISQYKKLSFVLESEYATPDIKDSAIVYRALGCKSRIFTIRKVLFSV